MRDVDVEIDGIGAGAVVKDGLSEAVGQVETHGAATQRVEIDRAHKGACRKGNF